MHGRPGPPSHGGKTPWRIAAPRREDVACTSVSSPLRGSLCHPPPTGAPNPSSTAWHAAWSGADTTCCPVPRVAGMHVGEQEAGVVGHPLTELRHVIASYAAMTDVDVVHDHTLAGPLYRR